MQDFQGRTAVVTGGGSGIGRALALALAGEGANVVVSDVEEAAAKAVADEVAELGRASLAVRTDVADHDAVLALADAARSRFGDVHVLCNNAGVSYARRGIYASHGDWVWMLGVNLWGVVSGCEAFLPQMLESGADCHIVNTSSMNGIFPSGQSAMYSTSKYGVMGLTETLRNELDGTKVGISALCPGGVTTNIRTSERNRPADLAPAEAPPAHVPSSTFDLSPARTPEEVGSMVVDGIREDRLYIFTDEKVQALIEQHHARMVADFDGLRRWAERHPT